MDRNDTPEQLAWRNMIYRCTNRKHERYKDYGGRGITIDPAWMDFDVFLADMGRKPLPELTLERIDNNGNYCKANCKWATKSEQQFNKRYRSYGKQWYKQWLQRRKNFLIFKT